jgi:hypothetical protein
VISRNPTSTNLVPGTAEELTPFFKINECVERWGGGEMVE